MSVFFLKSIGTSMCSLLGSFTLSPKNVGVKYDFYPHKKLIGTSYALLRGTY
jgi:hypothetical protein